MALIEPSTLAEKFRALLDAYESKKDGRVLVQWLREDWDLFADLNDAHSKELLGDILDDGDIVRRNYSPVVLSADAPANRWEELREELMHRNRFFPDVQVDLERLRNLLPALMFDPKEMPTRWYRARIQTGDDMLSLESMKAPPAKVASHGRANPAGIPYLYVASDRHTAISEVRPHTGERVCVADFETREDLRLIDLRHPRKSVSPFAWANYLPDADNFSQIRVEVAFLKRLGDELTRPVLPHVAAFEYAPSQFLCEFIKKNGFDGVIYRSSVGEGMNLALFEPEKATPGVVARHLVTKVHVAISDA